MYAVFIVPLYYLKKTPQIRLNFGRTTRRSVLRFNASPLFKSSSSMQVVVVDNHRACIGGLDLCFGRWDTHTHPLADAHPTQFSKTLFPGQDYNNARIMDFQQVDHFVSNQISILESARMPWHDVSIYLEMTSQLWFYLLCAKGTHDTYWRRCLGHCATLCRAME